MSDTAPNIETEDRLTTLQAVKGVPKRIKRHNLVVMAAGIAFYGLLALVPTLIALISIYTLTTPVEDVTQQIIDLTENFEDQESAKLLQNQVTAAAEEADGDSGIVGLVIGVGLALFAASGAVQKLMGTISLAYEAQEERKGWQVRGLAYVLTALSIVGIVLLLTILGLIPAWLSQLDMGQRAERAANIGLYAVAALAMMFGLTVLYRYAPDRKPRTPWVNPGAVVGTLAFLLFVFLFTLYFRLAGSMPASYGILGSIAALIIFIQLAAIAVIVGAEVNASIEEHREAAVTRAATTDRGGKTTTEAIPLGQAVAGLAALYILGRD